MIQVVEGKAAGSHGLGLDGFIRPQRNHFPSYHPIKIFLHGKRVDNGKALFFAGHDRSQGSAVFLPVHKDGLAGILGHKRKAAAREFFLIGIKASALHGDEMPPW
jgi:hypothetical protein